MIDFALDKRSPVPFYRQMVDLVLAGISSRRITPGEQLPTIRNLAVKLGVNPNTVAKAYTQLQILGVLDSQQGTGVFIRAAPERFGGEGDKRRATSALCMDFVGRAQLLGIGIDDLLSCLSGMKGAPRKEKRQ